MPTYEYRCKRCETAFEVFYKSYGDVEKEEPMEQCPKCDSTEKEKLISQGTTHVLKGKGWAKDGYR